LLRCHAGAAEARQALLDAIEAKKGDDEVIAALRKLAQYNPLPAPAKSPKIFGEWKLLWASANAEACTLFCLTPMFMRMRL
jgi:hypothetical protein